MILQIECVTYDKDTCEFKLIIVWEYFCMQNILYHSIGIRKFTNTSNPKLPKNLYIVLIMYKGLITIYK